MRFKMTHGFPELDFETTQRNYIASIKASAESSVANLKLEAEDASFAVNYLQRDSAEYLQNLLAHIESVQEDASSQRDVEDLKEKLEKSEEDYIELSNRTKKMRQKVSDFAVLLQECESLTEGNPALRAKIRKALV